MSTNRSHTNPTRIRQQCSVKGAIVSYFIEIFKKVCDILLVTFICLKSGYENTYLKPFNQISILNSHVTLVLT